VQVPVSVTDRRGGVIPGLQRGTFRVFEEGVEQEVSAVSSDDVPASVGFIFDTSGSMQAKLPMARLALGQFLKTANPQDEFFLLTFASRPGRVMPFTNGAEMILDEVRRAEANGNTALLDAAYAGIRNIKNARNQRRALVIISDGEDNHSRHSETAIREAERESDVQICAMCVPQVVYSRRGRISSDGKALLERLCIDTGGRSFEVDDEQNLPGVATRIGLQIRNEYMISYKPTNQKWDGKYRHITLKLIQPPGLPHLTACWRRGYYAQQGTGQ
jgi:Ca-activated chloride channel homolog